jgi:anti-anti-sigma factor
MNFDVKTEKLSDEQYVISLAGEVDLYTAPEFKQQLLEVIEQGGRDVVVDLSDTTFIDSTTLGVLVGGVKRLRTNDGSSRSSAATATSRRSSRSRASTACSRSTRRAKRPSARDLPPTGRPR